MTHLILRKCSALASRNIFASVCTNYIVTIHYIVTIYCTIYCTNYYAEHILSDVIYRPEFALCITHTYTQNRNIPHPCVDSVDLYVTPWTEGLLRRKISSLARRNFELLLTRIHGVCFAVDDGESSLALDEHVALNFPGRLSHLECTGSTKVNRRKQSQKITRRSQTSHKINTIKQELRLQFYRDKGRISLGIWIETRLAFLFHVTL